MIGEKGGVVFEEEVRALEPDGSFTLLVPANVLVSRKYAEEVEAGLIDEDELFPKKARTRRSENKSLTPSTENKNAPSDDADGEGNGDEQ